MAGKPRIRCPGGCHGGFIFGMEDADECAICNEDGYNGSGLTTRKRVAEYNAQCAAEEARHIAWAEANPWIFPPAQGEQK